MTQSDLTTHIHEHLSPRQSQALLGHWETWLKAAGAESVELQRF